MITPIVGRTYLVKHAGARTLARCESINVYNPSFNRGNRLFDRRSTTHYTFTNLKTGRTIILKSRVKILMEDTTAWDIANRGPIKGEN